MPIPSSKTELLDAIAQRFMKLNQALDTVPTELFDDKSMEGHVKGTLISPNNLVSYFIGWNNLVLKWLEYDDIGKNIVFPEVGYKWNQIGQLAQKFYTDGSGQTFNKNRIHLMQAKGRLVVEISNRTNQELYGALWYRKWTKGRMIQLNSASPYENARGRVRKWLRRKDI